MILQEQQSGVSNWASNLERIDGGAFLRTIFATDVAVRYTHSIRNDIDDRATGVAVHGITSVAVIETGIKGDDQQTSTKHPLQTSC